MYAFCVINFLYSYISFFYIISFVLCLRVCDSIFLCQIIQKYISFFFFTDFQKTSHFLKPWNIYLERLLIILLIKVQINQHNYDWSTRFYHHIPNYHPANLVSNVNNAAKQQCMTQRGRRVPCRSPKTRVDDGMAHN